MRLLNVLKMIASIKDSNGKVFSTIVQMKDGRWLEIKRNYKFRPQKEIFASEDDWIHSHEYSGICLMPVYGEREPYVSIKEKRKSTPISSELMDGDYLNAIQEKYKIRSIEPELKQSILDKASSLAHCITYHQSQLNETSNESYIQYLKKKIDEFNNEASQIQEKINTIGSENIQQEYKPLSRKSTIAYLQKEDEFLPIGYSKDKKCIVFEGRMYKSFSELNCSGHPPLWIWSRNSFVRAI